ncbi:MAG: DNA-directed RNA polymerase subunit A' [Candidatus Anstonellales archaeon]
MMNRRYERKDYYLHNIQFMIASDEIIKKLAKVEVKLPDTYDDNGYPIEGGLMDPRMGVVDPGIKCKTCGGTHKTCPGHFGYIKLNAPVIHPLFVKHLEYVLNNTCEKCHRFLNNPELRKGNYKIRNKVVCPHCGAQQSIIKLDKPYNFVIKFDKDDEKEDELLIKKIEKWLNRIPDEDVEELSKAFSPYAVAAKDYIFRPKDFLLNYLLVPPPRIRPSITLESGEKSEDDLTHALAEIIRVNEKLEMNKRAGAPTLIHEDHWRLLQYHVATYFDNELPGIPQVRHRSGRALKTLVQRLKGKEGRFRYNLNGKRVEYSARTVISPDVKIDFNQVGVPQRIAESQTVPIAVMENNIDYCKELIQRDVYPRAVAVISPTGEKRIITSTNREKILQEIGPGWVILRQLVDGDVVLFNRQPSLHRVSMMAHYVKVLPGKTFRINPLITPPYNADFDGDEMNLHVLQLEEARVEAMELMDGNKHILSIRNGRALIKHSEDGVTGLYFLSKQDTVIDKNNALRMLANAGFDIKNLPIKNSYTGRELLEMLLPPDLSMEADTKLGVKLKIQKGKILEGAIDGKALDELIKRLVIVYGDDVAAQFINKSFKMGIEYLTLHGITVSYKNYYVDDNYRKKIVKELQNMDRKIEELIEKFKSRELDRLPGMSMKQTLEALIMQVTTETRNAIGKLLENYFGTENSSILMAKIGSRGSLLNVIQMSGTVGQQVVRNRRPWRGYYKRLLPFFDRGKLEGRERGYVYGCFTTGLDVDEFFAHSIAGRESIVNTAIRTSRSGYMQRRLINALADYYVEDDISVRDSNGRIIQFLYGGDAKNPMYMGVKGLDVDDTRKDDIDTV